MSQHLQSHPDSGREQDNQPGKLPKKAPYQSYANFIDIMIREADKRGEFQDLPGAGKPIPSLDEPYQEDWWLQQWVKRENLSTAPQPLELRRKVEVLTEDIPTLPTQARVQEQIEIINRLIDISNRNIPAALAPLANLDVDKTIKTWKDSRDKT